MVYDAGAGARWLSLSVILSAAQGGAAGYMEGYIAIMIEAFISGGEPFLFRF